MTVKLETNNTPARLPFAAHGKKAAATKAGWMAGLRGGRRGRVSDPPLL